MFVCSLCFSHLAFCAFWYILFFVFPSQYRLIFKFCIRTIPFAWHGPYWRGFCNLKMKTELLYFCPISLKRTVYWLFFSMGYETGMGVVPISQTTVGTVISSINNTSRETKATCLNKSFSFLSRVCLLLDWNHSC